MKTLIFQLFFSNWQRKLVALVLAFSIWMLVNHSMTITKVIHNIPVRVVNLPPEKTIEGMQINGLLNQRISLTISGNKELLDELSGKDLEAIIDGNGKSDEWIASIGQKNLISHNPELDLAKAIFKVAPHQMIIKPSKLITEKIPVLIMQPIGEAPKGYQYLDVWPYQLFITVNGPEESVKRLKTRGLKLTFNLNDVTQDELDTLANNQNKSVADEVSYFVPNSWKKIALPNLSDVPVEIDDPQANTLRIDFSRQDLLPIGTAIPVTVFFPPKYSSTINPDTYTLAVNDFIQKKNGIKSITTPLYAQGVSRLFLETVKDMIQIVIIATPKSEHDKLLWNAQFMYPHELEDRYIARVMSESTEELSDVQPHLREDYLRNRFRSYMNRFRLYTPNRKKLSLKIELQANSISVAPQNLDS